MRAHKSRASSLAAAAAAGRAFVRALVRPFVLLTEGEHSRNHAYCKALFFHFLRAERTDKRTTANLGELERAAKTKQSISEESEQVTERIQILKSIFNFLDSRLYLFESALLFMFYLSP